MKEFFSRISLSLLGLVLLSFNATAMEFRIYRQPELNQNVVIGEGPIRQGDAEKFTAIAKKADRDSEGHITFVLNSPGGSVDAAFKLVDAMDKIGVFTIVPDNAICASACASVVYASGIRRDVVGTGRLGFHSCYSKSQRSQLDAKKQRDESSFCNELIAHNAMMRGLADASVSLFVEDYGPNEVAWVGRDVACTMLPGMCKPTLKVVIKPSFDCDKAKTTPEKLICSNQKLANLDVAMAKAYKARLENSSNPKEVQADQAAWRKNKRDVCTDNDCLLKVYFERITVLATKPKE